MGKMAERGFWWACSECKSRNYATYKNKKNNPDKLQIKKYCKVCRKHTLHVETGINASSGK